MDILFTLLRRDVSGARQPIVANCAFKKWRARRLPINQMKNRLNNIRLACCHALRTKRDWFWFVILTAGFFVLFVMIPVWTTPGDSFLFHLSILDPEVYVLMISLSVLNAMVLMFHRHIRRVQKTSVTAGQVSSGLGAVASGLIATIGCGACYSGVLAVFGLTGTVFVVEHRWWFAALAGFLAIWAIDSAAQKIVGGCNKCNISRPNN